MRRSHRASATRSPVSNAWNSTLGKGTQRSLTIWPPPFAYPSLNPFTNSSPAAYFQDSVTTFFTVLPPASTAPVAKPDCQFENDVRKMFGAHSGPVAAARPAFGMMCRTPASRVTRIIAAATPE